MGAGVPSPSSQMSPFGRRAGGGGGGGPLLFGATEAAGGGGGGGPLLFGAATADTTGGMTAAFAAAEGGGAGPFLDTAAVVLSSVAKSPRGGATAAACASACNAAGGLDVVTAAVGTAANAVTGWALALVRIFPANADETLKPTAPVFFGGCCGGTGALSAIFYYKSSIKIRIKIHGILSIV